MTLFLQVVCSGQGMCTCEGTCRCTPPYSGEFCEVCIGDPICSTSNCASNMDCAMCILNLVDPKADIFTVEEFFLGAMENDSNIGLPPGSAWSLNPNDDGASEIITLAMAQCPVCSNGAVILSRVSSSSYSIDGELVLKGCW